MKEAKLWQYNFPTIREPKFCGWARVILSDDGMFTALSDYDDHSYWWTSTGEKDFRKFILGLNDGYMIDKFSYGRDKVYDGDQTLKAIKQVILEYRRRDDLDKEKAREFWDELDEFSDLRDQDDFRRWYENAMFPRTFSDCHEYATYVSPPRVVAFVQLIIPRLKEAIRKQLEEEAQHSPPPEQRAT